MNIKKNGVLLPGLFLLTRVVSAQQQPAQSDSSQLARIEVQEIVIMALEKSYDVELAKNTSFASNTDAKNAKGLFIPDFTLTGQRTKSEQKQHSEYDDRPSVDTKPKATNTQYGAQITWTLFDGLKMFSTY